MDSVINVGAALLQILIRKYHMEPSNPLDPEAIQMAESLVPIVEGMCSGYLHDSTTLDFGDDSEEVDENDDRTDDTQRSSQGWEMVEVEQVNFSLDYMRKVIEFYDSKKSKKFEKTAARFRDIKYPV